MSAEYIANLKNELGADSGVWQQTSSRVIPLLREALPQLLADKSYEPDGVRRLLACNMVGKLLDAYFFGNYEAVPPVERRSRHTSSKTSKDEAGRASFLTDYTELAIGRAYSLMPGYHGSELENAEITELDLRSGGSLQRDYVTNGASRIFKSDILGHDYADRIGVSDVPCAIVGAGASGILSARFLSSLGFCNITIFDKKGRFTGIWGQDKVREGSKNNPFDIHYDSVVARSARQVAPEGSGRDIERFLTKLAVGETGYNNSLPEPYRAVVTGIEPGDLEHVVCFKEDDQEASAVFPIVIYAAGLGTPLPISHAGHMETPMNNNEAGQRWQKQLSSKELTELAGKRVVLIGLGNSTAEMVLQFQRHQFRTGEKIDYRIITHYPHQNIFNPDSESVGRQVYRNVNLPELSHLAGDLPHINSMYKQALRENKIIGNVVSWSHEGNVMTATTRDGQTFYIPFDKQYTLIGYGQRQEVNDKMGLTTNDDYTGMIKHDWDGEAHSGVATKGRARLFPGYFAIGPILGGSCNPNALVIPGIQYQLQQMIPTLVIRASEYAARHRNPLTFPSRV